MQSFEIITVGRIKSPWIKEGRDHYLKLLSRYADIQLLTVKEADSAAYSPEKVMKIESAGIIAKLKPQAYRMMLTPGNEQFDSVDLSKLIKASERDYPLIQFIIGGAFGLDESVRRAADTALSLSKMTFPHELTLILLLEQLYRAYSIAAGTKYHK